jgi:hypothetical protein
MYTVTFEDNTKFKGGPITDTKWNDMPNKKIQSIVYKLNKGKRVVISGFDAYNQIIEKVKFANRASNERITKVILMARKDKETYQLIFNFRLNKIEQKKTMAGFEYMNKPVLGWKTGSASDNSVFKLS